MRPAPRQAEFREKYVRFRIDATLILCRVEFLLDRSSGNGSHFIIIVHLPYIYTGGSTTFVLKFAGETISKTSKSSEHAISRCLIIGTWRTASPFRIVRSP
jgi:hypothetical protein